MAFPPRQPRGNFNPRFRKEQQQEHRTNQMIRVPQVRLVGDNVAVGVYPIQDALRMAQEQELDLVEISPQADPPVCKIIDYNKFLYEKKKKEKEMKEKEARDKEARDKEAKEKKAKKDAEAMQLAEKDKRQKRTDAPPEMDLIANKKELSQKITDEMAGLFLLLLLFSSLFVCLFVGLMVGSEEGRVKEVGGQSDISQCG